MDGSVGPSRNPEPNRLQEEDLRRQRSYADPGFDGSACAKTPPADQRGGFLLGGCREGVGVRCFLLFLLDPVGKVGDFGENVGAGS